jgi:hypothetical protein
MTVEVISSRSKTVSAFRGSSTLASPTLRSTVIMSRKLFLCLLLLANSCSHRADDDRAIREQVANYTKALATGDLGLAGRVWWDAKDVSEAALGGFADLEWAHSCTQRQMVT